MTRVHRLDPARPALWRDVDTLQFGLQPSPRVDDPSVWQLRLLHALAIGVPDATLPLFATDLGVPVDEIHAFLALITDALIPEPPTLSVHVVLVSESVPVDAAAALVDALRTMGYTLSGNADVVIPVAAHVLLPAQWTRWQYQDRAHLPVVFVGDGAHIGPLVRPGTTACFACLASDERDRDPAWPTLVAQLAGRELPHVAPSLAAEAGGLVGRLLDAGDGDVSRSVRLGIGSRRSWRTHRPRADCGCRSPAGIETVSAPRVPSHATS